MQALLESEVRANQTVAGDQITPSLPASPLGDVLALWFAPRRAQMFDADGNPLGGEIALLTATSTANWLPNGELVVFNSAGLQLQRYDRGGNPVGSPVTLPDSGTGDDIAALASGHLLATFRTGNQYRGQLLDSNFAPQGEDFLIRDVGTLRVDATTLVPLTGGGFAVIFDFGSSGAVSARQHLNLFDANGNPLPAAEELRGANFDAAAMPDGGLVITITGNYYNDSNGRMIILNADGSSRSSIPFHPGHEWDVAVLESSVILLTWQTFSAGNRVNHGQLYDLDGRALGAELDLGTSPGVGPDGINHYDLQGIGGNEFATIEVLTGVAGGGGYDPVVKHWSLDGLILGTTASDSLDGIGVDAAVLVGRTGDDLFFVDQAADAVVDRVGEGFDRVLASASYVLTAGQEIEMFTTTNNISTAPIDLTGNERSQYIYGNYGANRLDGGGGGDVLIGFLGDDTYIVRTLGDDVRENAGEGFDRVNVALSYTLAAGREIEMLATTANSGTDAINITGNEISQYLYGNYGNNILNGGGGADVMIGFLGHDTFIVSETGDDVREAIGEGQDRVIASVSFALGAGQSVEFLQTSDENSTAAIDLAGNALLQEIIGNAGANVLTSGGGGDFVHGLAGDDTYFIAPEDLIQEFVGGGFDRVFVSGSYTLAGSEIEVLTPTDEFGTAQINMTGNAFAQYVYGNDGANRLDGGGGGDILVGRGGDDLLIVRHAGDQVREDANDGSDRVLAFTSWRANAGAQVEVISTDDNLGAAPINLTGNEFAQYVYGNAGSNTIGGAGGKDVLNGLGGADFFLFDTALNTAFTPNFAALADSANVDRIDSFAADDKIALSGALFGFTPGGLPAGAFNTGTTATDADDRILWDAASRTLLFDADGTGAQAAQMIAVLSDPFNLDASFIVVV